MYDSVIVEDAKNEDRGLISSNKKNKDLRDKCESEEEPARNQDDHKEIYNHIKKLFSGKADQETATKPENSDNNDEPIEKKTEPPKVSKEHERLLKDLSHYITKNKGKFRLLLNYCQSLVNYLNLHTFEKIYLIKSIVGKFRYWDINIKYLLKELIANFDELRTEVENSLNNIIQDCSGHLTIQDIFDYDNFIRHYKSGGTGQSSPSKLTPRRKNRDLFEKYSSQVV